METLAQLLEEQVKDLYNAETQLTTALPKMVKGATSPELKKAIEEHLKETQQHVERLKEVAGVLEISPMGKTCAAMKGLIEEGKEALSDGAEGFLRDAAIVAAAQRVEHYEIAAYGTARAMAQQLGNSRVANILEETLDEESTADEILTEVVTKLIYPHLVEQGESEEKKSPAGRRSGNGAGRRPAMTSGR